MAKGILRTYVAPVLAAVALLALLRGVLLPQVAVETARPELGLMAGDRVLVWRPAYGLRLPFADAYAPRWGQREPQRGDCVVFDCGDGRLGLARVEALPGDSIEGRGRVPRGCCWTGSYLLPQRLLAGRLLCVSYSVDAGRPWTQALRRGRWFRRVR